MVLILLFLGFLLMRGGAEDDMRCGLHHFKEREKLRTKAERFDGGFGTLHRFRYPCYGEI